MSIFRWLPRLIATVTVAVAPVLGGCATVIHGTRQNVRVET